MTKDAYIINIPLLNQVNDSWVLVNASIVHDNDRVWRRKWLHMI